MESLSTLDNRVTFYKYNIPFNYSKIDNYAVKEYASSKYIILLNNYIEIIIEDWIDELLSFALKSKKIALG